MTSAVVHFRYLHFLESLFTKVRNEVEGFMIFDCYEDLAQHWHGKLSDATYQTTLYENVVKVKVFFHTLSRSDINLLQDIQGKCAKCDDIGRLHIIPVSQAGRFNFVEILGQSTYMSCVTPQWSSP